MIYHDWESRYLTFLIRDVLTWIVQNRHHYVAFRAKQPRKTSGTLLSFSLYIWTETPHLPDSFADTLLSYIFVALSIYQVWSLTGFYSLSEQKGCLGNMLGDIMQRFCKNETFLCSTYDIMGSQPSIPSAMSVLHYLHCVIAIISFCQ